MSLESQLAWLVEAPEGTLAEIAAGPLRLQVAKRGGQVGLFFINPSGGLDGPMSRIDPARPLALLAEYTQALMLALIWQPDPARAAILGFGGGRLSLLLHHHFPDVQIDNVDIDIAFAELAERFFGVTLDGRQRFHVADARAFIEAPGPRYDLLLIDAFSDERDDLDHLGTLEFFQACRARLSRGGALALNLLRSDPGCGAKAAALHAAMPHCYVVPLKHSLVLLAGGQSRIAPAQIVRRAQAIAAAHGFEFPLTAHAEALRPLRLGELGLGGIAPLRDAHASGQ
jgi:spermidine synthase